MSRASIPAPLHQTILSLRRISPGIPKSVNVTAWGSPLKQDDDDKGSSSSALHTIFYFGGMPASAQEPALHSIAAGESDCYAARRIHCICLDKPGMGQTPLRYWFQIHRDWPEIVLQVAHHYGIERYAVAGVSNGGPYVMACLTHPATRENISTAAMIVGVSDVVASNYFSLRKHPSGFMEGLYNSLPIAITGPLNYVLLSAGSLYLRAAGGFEKVFADLPSLRDNLQAKKVLGNVISDGAKTAGLGSAIDCQQGLSPLWGARPKGQAIAEFEKVSCPVSLWYGTKDSTVPLASAKWLHEILPRAVLHERPTGHGLFFYHTAEILDELVANAEMVEK